LYFMNLLIGGRLITALKLPIWGGESWIGSKEPLLSSDPSENYLTIFFQNQISNLLSQTPTISLDIFIGSRIECRRGWLRNKILLPMLMILKSTYRHWRAPNFLKISTATHLLNRQAKKNIDLGKNLSFSYLWVMCDQLSPAFWAPRKRGRLVSPWLAPATPGRW
jgi:hypothetical protein